MSIATGVGIKAAIKRAAVWGTAVECGALDGILILPHTIRKTRAAVPDESLGIAFAKDIDMGQIKVEGALTAYLRYDSLDLMLALVMGATGGAPARQGSTAAYSQRLTLADALDGRFATFALDNGVNVDEYASVKLTGFVIRGEVGRPLEVAFDCIAIDRETGSEVNTRTTFAAVTCMESANRVLMSQGVIRLNDAAGAALADGDRIYPSQFELSLKRVLAGAYTVGSGDDRIDEPVTNGVSEALLKLVFPRYTSTGLFGDWDAATVKKLDMTFTGSTIEGAYKRTFKISMPALRAIDVALPIERGALRNEALFECLSASSAPAGMTGITSPFQVDVINRKSADVLA